MQVQVLMAKRFQSLQSGLMRQIELEGRNLHSKGVPIRPKIAPT